MAKKMDTLMNKKKRLEKETLAAEQKLQEKREALNDAERLLMEEMMIHYELSPEDVVELIQEKQGGED